MKVFISWSGEPSKQVAELLKAWIEDVLQGAQTWISTEDIEKGTIWFGEIGGQLAERTVGILCLTRENINAPWILFEAGALSKGLTKSRVCPLLINLKPEELTQPLSLFNATLPTREDMLKLVKAINDQDGDKRLPAERLQKAFEQWWNDFETKFTDILKAHKPLEEPRERPLKDMVAEILNLSRSIQASLQEQTPNPWGAGPPLYRPPTISTLDQILAAQSPEKKRELRIAGDYRRGLVASREVLEDILKAEKKTGEDAGKPKSE